MSSDLSAPAAAATGARPLIFGHRGAAGLAPENTLPSFAAALDCGVDGIELDVYSAHERLWVLHDETLARTTNGSGSLLDHSAIALRGLNAGDGAQIPFLEEVLAFVQTRAAPQFTVNIELKGPHTATPVLAATRHLDPAQLLISCFDHSQLHTYRALGGKARIGVLMDQWRPEGLRTAQALDAWSIHLSQRIVTAERTERIQALGFRVLAYTVNRLPTARRLLRDGVDGLFTDRPDRISSAALAD